MRQAIYDFLYNDETGLSESYGPDETASKSQLVFTYIFQNDIRP